MEENSPVKGTHDTSITVIDWPPPGDTAIEREREREREAEEEEGVHPPHCNFGDRRGGGETGIMGGQVSYSVGSNMKK